MRTITCTLVALVALASAALLVPVNGQERRERASRGDLQDDAAIGQWRTDPQHQNNVYLGMLENLPYVPGEVLVRFKSGSEPVGQAGALSSLRLDNSQTRTRWVGDVLHVVSLGIDEPEHAAAILRAQPEVLYAQPNYRMHTNRVPNDSYYSSQWNFDAINMQQAWDINWGASTGRRVTVAVVDSGLTTASGTYYFSIWTGNRFQSLPVPFAKTSDFNHNNVLPGKDFAFHWTILFDASSHGTHVAGTIAQQTDNGTGYAGIAHGVTVLPVKVCRGYWDWQLEWGYTGRTGYVPTSWGGECVTSDVIEGLRWAVDSGAQIVNMSIGGTNPNPAYQDALRYAVQKGTFVAVAAGNEGDKGNPTGYPAAYAEQIDGVVAVGAVNRALQRAYYSSFGPYVELAAPGGDSSGSIWQVVPNSGDLSYLLYSPRFDRYESGSKAGTSMASPHVAGVAALLYSQGITNPAAIEAALKAFAKDLGASGRDNEYGYGLIDARASLRGMGVAK
jgi:serine protease